MTMRNGGLASGKKLLGVCLRSTLHNSTWDQHKTMEHNTGIEQVATGLTTNAHLWGGCGGLGAAVARVCVARRFEGAGKEAAWHGWVL